MPGLSIATNASLADEVRVREVIPHWLRVFGDRLGELLIVLDPSPPSGRIAALHGGAFEPGAIRRALDEVAGLDARIRVVELPPEDGLGWLTRTWFSSGHPIRCQGGTPIIAFLYAIAAATEPVVFRVDCDVLFHDDGWIDEAMRLGASGNPDLIQPPGAWHAGGAVSTRAFILNWPLFASRRLPIHPYRLDPLRRVHRRLQGRAPWLALETTLQRHVDAGRLSHAAVPGGGSSIHVIDRADMEYVASRGVARRVERGDIPAAQLERPDFDTSVW